MEGLIADRKSQSQSLGGIEQGDHRNAKCDTRIGCDIVRSLNIKYLDSNHGTLSHIAHQKLRRDSDHKIMGFAEVQSALTNHTRCNS